MEIIIEHSKTKREINGPFNLCGGANDLRAIADAILSGVKKDDFYGWIKVTAAQEPFVSRQPESWDKEK